MGKYEELLQKHQYITVEDKFELPGDFKGFLDNDVILIDRNLTGFQKHEVLAEEVAHYYLSSGNILDQSNILNRKFELKARREAYESVITLQGIVDAFEYGVHNLHEMSLYFEVSKSFVENCINHYKLKYGLSVRHNNYIIQFEPLIIYKDI
ncbi:ImmA/IrrE family metallo-endopeptidase [Staphylococcus canis]|uniref:ImmA/IrrE family metallo-endopeptidase n=1 Tax=Staphylococcus canis TaxID=2724942 RepID=A0ABS0T8U1_9STAP|nr:ImmA/IrrE family metallo-endopeptidase [Staphylococcus canis]MBI5975164.1 ImmA/IrrE family metallo-endopeptidase [Staphylococcus canis]